MRMNSFLGRGVVACLLAGSMGLTACATGTANNLTEEQQANRAFMSQVNETMVDLDSGLDAFIDAVSRNDLVNMRTQADVAYRALDKLAEIEAPEELADVRDSYVEGTADLKEALDAYITLYSEAQNSGFDWSKYDSRLKEIQKQYDKGVAALEAGDKAAAEA